MAGDNPYRQETDENTSTTWLGDQKPVDIDLDGMGEFAKNMGVIKDNLASHTSIIQQLMSGPTDAWQGGALPEGAYTRKQMLANAQELMQYFNYLGTALNNIGMAAQTIADAFSGTDGWSAASLNAVKWAFGDTSAERPAGLPPWVTGKTYWDSYFESLEKASESTDTSGVKWDDQGKTTNPDGSTTQRSVAPDGRVREITTFTVPGGGPTIVTTTLLGKDGKVLSTSSTHSTTYMSGNSVVTTTTSYDGDSKQTGSTAKSTTYGNNGQVTDESTTTYDKDGQQTRATETKTNADQSQTTTVTRHDEKTDKEKVIQEVHTGANTQGVDDVGEAPAKDAMDDIQRTYG